MPGRALLIGASEYGEGPGFFGNLPAAKRDVEVMKRALEARDFDVEIVSENVAKNPWDLSQAIKNFCQSVTDGVGIVYFSGHGMSLEGQDWLIPAGVSREDARRISTSRVSTDLSQFDIHDKALILLIIDACRDLQGQSTSKGGEGLSHGWSRSAVQDDKRFIRLFGCGEGERCHVWLGGDDGKDVSIFTFALSEVLKPESPVETLEDVLTSTKTLCAQFASKANPKVDKQTPSIGGIGDINSDTLSQLCDRPIFHRALAPVFHGALAAESILFPELGAAFDPGKLQCLVINSEHATRDDQPKALLLSDRVERATLRCGDAIWGAFRSYWSGRSLVDGKQRPLADVFTPNLLKVGQISVPRAFESRPTLEHVIRWLVQADIVFFDLTRFEPGALFLLGLRAATRRGLTICSHGQGWREGEELVVPFNLNDLQVFSHSGDPGVGEDPVVRRMAKAVQWGFEQMTRQPRFQDLPAYDSLRELGSDLNSWQTIPSEKLVLTLCSFRPENRQRWSYLETKIMKALSQCSSPVVEPQVSRLIDLGSSQLVSQSLYEHIRRVAGCVMDWSLFSPSTFMELGVRLAVSPWGAVQLIEKSFLPGGPGAAHLINLDGSVGPELRQVKLMDELLVPRRYSPEDENDDFADVAEALVSRLPFDEINARTSSYCWIHYLVREAIEPVSLSIPPVYQMLCERAESLSSSATQRDRREVTQALFNASTVLKKDREVAALEARIAAWLYLEHRLMSQNDISDETRALHQQLGEDVVAALYEEGNFAFAETIMQRIQDQP